MLQGVTTGYRGLRGVTRGYRGLQGVKRGYKGSQKVTSCYIWLQGATRGYRGLPGFTGDYKGLHVFSREEVNSNHQLIIYLTFQLEILTRQVGSRGLQGVTRSYRGLQGVTVGYKVLQGVTGGYKLLQGVTRGFRGLQGVTRGYIGDIAETLNCFFVGQQKNLTFQIGLNNDSSTWARPPPPPSLSPVSGTFYIPQISRDKVVNLLLSVPVYKATGNDGVTAKLLRIAAPAIADSLCKLINFCIEKQTFPTKWKVGKVTPIYNVQGNRDDKNNYRPITVLAILSKLPKKHIL